MKPLTFAVLRLLADGEFHSGEDLARGLGMSRASVWNALKEADQLGVALYKIRGRGYRLAQPPQWLDQEKIAAALGAQANRFSLEIIDHTDSTNTLLLQKAARGAPKGSVVAAEWQTHGRGRRGRSWHMNLGGGLTFSVLWRFEQGAGFLSGLSLAVGVALARALKSMGVEEIALKWPNDVLHHYRKLAGILIEVQGDVLGPSLAVIGIGINLRLSETARSSIDQAVTDVYSTTRIAPDSNRVLGSVLAHLAQVLDFFEARGFAGVREEWSSLHAYHRKNVLVMLPDGGVEEGKVIGVDDNGSLLLLAGGGERRYNSGEISLRGKRAA
ncbi:MAG TPA: biotin--[acetyl-CoA-carboxylase] ligase [Burkholderiales bacterium]|nr:biotin--[acetyl-CoA-carboxylase] ligase [Burkholderiales bacterium]